MNIQTIEKEPMACVYCGSVEIDAERIDGECYSRRVNCAECERSWHECFKFVGIITDEG